MLTNYQYHRRHFFDQINLSDVRLLRTPLYFEKVKYYISRFITQQTDTLIHNSYRLLELASGSYETFFFMSDFLIDFSLRYKIDNISKLHNFLQRNRTMLGTEALQFLPVRQRNLQIMVPAEQSLKDKLNNLPLTDIDGKDISLQEIPGKFRILYFWDVTCPRCMAGASQWQRVLDKYKSKSCIGIAVNTQSDVKKTENRILAYDPLCVNLSFKEMPLCERIFYTGNYSKIIVTDTVGNIIGIFGSIGSLDEFLSRI